MDHSICSAAHPRRIDVLRTLLHQRIPTLVNDSQPTVQSPQQPLLDPHASRGRHLYARRSLRHRCSARTPTRNCRSRILATLPSARERPQSRLQILPRLLPLLLAKHLRHQCDQLLLPYSFQIHRRHRNKHQSAHHRHLRRHQSSRNHHLAPLPNRQPRPQELTHDRRFRRWSLPFLRRRLHQDR